jgi:hypothetical protein
MSHLSLTYNPNGTDHRDLELCFAGQRWKCNSYYLVIDEVLVSGVEVEAKVRTVLRRLLEQWAETVESLEIGGTAYLPYDFSDQYTGWLRCTRTETGLSMVRGWSDVEGWSFSPSEVGELLNELTGFRANGPMLEAPLSEILAAIQDSVLSAA